jgi:hypothetical protein
VIFLSLPSLLPSLYFPVTVEFHCPSSDFYLRF